MAILKAEKLFRVLVSEKVNFILVGGFAGIAHGMNYLTDDLDICYDRSPQNLRRLVQALSPAHPRLRTSNDEVPFLFDEKTLKNGLNFTLQTDWGSLDLLGEISGIGTYRDLKPHAINYEFYGLQILTMSLEELIQAKKIANRPKDQLHLMELEAIRDIQGLKAKK